LNAAARLSTEIDALALARLLHQVEDAAGRVRSARWGERTLDLDLLLFGNALVDTPELVVPHLGMAVRRFVLAPLAEIAPDAVDPLTGLSVAALLRNLDRRPSYVAISEARGLELAVERLFARVVADLSAVAICGDHIADRTRMIGVLGRGQFAESARWIVSDFWLDDWWDGATRAADSSGCVARGAAANELRSQIVQPTFAVIADERAFEPLSEWARQERARELMGCDCPILRMRSPEGARWMRTMREVAEHMPQDPAHSPENRAAEDTTAWDTACREWVEVVAAEVVAACQATRT
jgi:hypothetical protein